MQSKPTVGKLESRLRGLGRYEGFADEVQAFDRKCRGWLRQDNNRDGRGVSARATGKAFKGCRQFEKAMRAQGHADPTIRREAHKAVRGVLHRGFPEILGRLSTLWGQVSKADRRLAESRRQAGARIRALGSRFELRELRSLASLQEVGRAMGNCVENRRWARSYLRDEDAEMWAVFCQQTQRPLYLVKVDGSAGREVIEFEGRGGETPELERPFARKLLRALDAQGDDLEAFAGVGAFSSCLDALPEVEAIAADGGLHRVWIVGDAGDDREIVMASRWPDEARWGWSRFTRRRGRRRRIGGDGGVLDADGCNRLSEGALLAMVLRHPELAEKLRGA